MYADIDDAKFALIRGGLADSWMMYITEGLQSTSDFGLSAEEPPP